MNCLVTFWMPQTTSETAGGNYFEQLAQFTIERQPVCDSFESVLTVGAGWSFFFFYFVQLLS